MNDEIQIELVPDHDGRTIRVKSGIVRLSDSRLNRFWDKVKKPEDKTGCWIWTAAKYEFGYGCFGIGEGKTHYAHRISFQIANGPIPYGICVLHNCPSGDNPACVNPDHLWLGTRWQNNRDCISKGRARHPTGLIKNPATCVRGERVNTAKLKRAEVDAIKSEYATGKVRQIDLAKRYGVSQGAISSITRGRNWRLKL